MGPTFGDGRRPPREVEVIGIPGIGKTAACRGLLDGSDGAAEAWVSRPGTGIRRSILPKLLVPVAWWRFRRLLRSEPYRDGKPWRRLRATRTILRRRAGKLWRARDPLVSTLFLLSATLAEVSLARLEAALRRRTLVLDEGFVHRTLGVRMRARPADRDRVTALYLETLARSATCLWLRGDPEMARKRAEERAAGLPPVTTRNARDLARQDPSRDAMREIYRDYAEVFALPALHERVRVKAIDVDGDPAAVGRQIASALDALGIPHRPLLYLRDRGTN
jgi:hypothetical protein